MGIPLEIFSLHRLQGEGASCQHYLLLRVARRAFSNADEGDYADAVEAADKTRSALLETFEEEVLAGECAGRHTVNLVGELQASPAGGELSEGGGGFYVDLWVAATRFGHPWVVMGTARDEEEFWRGVARDEDLSGLGPSAPAARRRAYFLADEGDATRDGS